jgi:hypothetical protein
VKKDKKIMESIARNPVKELTLHCSIIGRAMRGGSVIIIRIRPAAMIRRTRSGRIQVVAFGLHMLFY